MLSFMVDTAMKNSCIFVSYLLSWTEVGIFLQLDNFSKLHGFFCEAVIRELK